jgi:hypothetical protein
MLRKMLGHFMLLLVLLIGTSIENTEAQVPRKGLEGTSVIGPDVIVGELFSLQQSGSDGTQVGLAVGTDSCNNGDEEFGFFAMPNTDHPVLAQNLYRMSGGPTNDDRFEQIGQSWLAHAFFALQNNACGFGCTPDGSGTHLGVGCSNADTAGINGSQGNLGSRAWVNPFTGIFPSTANSHNGHTHSGTAHRILVEASDLDPAMNQGATYYAEGQFITPDEYAWCQDNPGQCNMYNNASYRQFNVAGTGNFVFSPIGSTARMTPAINAWTGATIQTIEPEPGVDGRAFLAYKVTGPVAGLYHYEYAIYNQNLDRGIQSFRLPMLLLPGANGAGPGPQNIAFHAPPQHPGFSADGTQGNAGFSGAEWASSFSGTSLTWNSETFVKNPNANAIRWGTLYNFRFDSTAAPQAADATIGFFKTGAPITVPIQGPAPTGGPSPTPTPGPATHFAVTVPAFAVSGVPFDFTVIAQDSANNTATGYTGLVHFTSSDPSATLPSNSTLTNGAGTFQATLNQLPTQTITATDTVNGSITGTSNPISIIIGDPTPSPTASPFPTPFPEPATHFAVNAPPAVGIFQTFSFTVRALDLFNNTATNYTGTVRFTTTSQQALLPPDSTLINGFGTFDANLQELGIQTITATDTVNSSITGTSNDILVVDDQVPTPTPSPTATPTPTPIPPTQPLNVSTRLRVQTGDNAGIGGFIVTGNDTKRVLLRGIGPSLAPGISDVLANPTLDLRDSTGVRILANNDWRDMQATEIKATGIPPTNNLEAAIVQTLDPGNYSVILRGMGMTSGVGLVEIYDLDQGTGSRLANLSTRAFVSAGDNVVIAGFILGGSGDENVLVRGIGPSLTAAGVPGALSDPTLELRDSDGTLLAANDNWQNGPPIPPDLAPGNQLESAIAATLPPGSYTALLAGVNNGTGVGLVELYDLGP